MPFCRGGLSGTATSLARSITSIGLGAALAATLVPANAQSGPVEDPPTVIRNTLGEVGLLDMPSAHMAPDGQMDFTVGEIGQQQRYSFSFQRKGWFEGTLRYSHVVGLHPGYDDFHFYDRSFAAKFRVVKENDDLPDISIGIRDALGTGVFSSEYLAASKHFGSLDLTAGLGWGELADRSIGGNPLGLIVPSFKTRPDVSVGRGGLPDFNVFFRGPVGIFGGAVWQTPIEGLRVVTEYSSFKYNGYIYGGGLKVRSPINLGLQYQPWSFLSLSGGWFYGSTYGLTVSVIGDPTTTYPSSMRIGPAVPPPAIRTDAQQRTALSLILESGKRMSSTKAAGLWVNVPTPEERSRQDLLQAFYSEVRGVRDVEINGTTLIVDASIAQSNNTQCASYARIASTTNTKITSIALADLEDPNGSVTFCPIAAASAGFVRRPRTMRGDGADFDKRAFQETLGRALVEQSLKLDAVSVGTSELWLYYENYRFGEESEAIGRIIRVLMINAPPSVEIFHIVAVKLGVPMQEITVARSAMERALLNNTKSLEMDSAIALSTAPFDTTLLRQDTTGIYPLFTWSLDPKLAERVYDPDEPLQFMVFADANGLLQLAPGWMLSTELTGTIWTNYLFRRDANSALPHVRTEILQYQKHGKYGISSLDLTYRDRAAEDVYTELRAGYLEDMFMGAGGQVLWRPEGSRLAFGADVYQVWQRDFNRLFGIQRYNILTGHVSVYYETPWNNLNVAIHAGRYLAGDYGATLQLTRRFSTGVEVGAWATFTNVPFNKFGEGSFDKGIIIRIPFEWGLPIFSQSSFDLHLASLTRDGGQRLNGDDTLYDATRMSSYGEITGHLDDVADP